MFVALIEASSPDLHRDGQFVSIKRLAILARLRTVFAPTIFLRILRIDVDQLNDKVAVSAGS